MTEKTKIVDLIRDGMSVSYKNRLTVSDLDQLNTNSFKFKRGFQVHCDVSRFQHSKLYFEAEDAVDAFLDLRKKIKLSLRYRRNDTSRS